MIFINITEYLKKQIFSSSKTLLQIMIVIWIIAVTVNCFLNGRLRSFAMNTAHSAAFYFLIFTPGFYKKGKDFTSKRLRFLSNKIM